MDIQKEREAFEAWLKSLNENGRTTYFLGQESTVAWEAWQAAKAQAVPEGFVLVPKEPTDIEIESIKEKHWDMRGCQLCKSDYIDLYKAMIEPQEPTND